MMAMTRKRNITLANRKIDLETEILMRRCSKRICLNNNLYESEDLSQGIPLRASTAPARPLTELEDFRRSSDFLLLENAVMLSSKLMKRSDNKYDLDSSEGQRICKRFLGQIERLCEVRLRPAEASRCCQKFKARINSFWSGNVIVNIELHGQNVVARVQKRVFAGVPGAVCGRLAELPD